MIEEALEAGLRAAGLLTAIGLAVVSAMYEAGWCAWYLFETRLPISLVLALVGNPAIVWFASSTTGWRAAGIFPAIAWCCVWFPASVQTSEGDLIVASGNWVGVATTLLGPLAFAVPIYRRIVAGRAPRPSPQT
ncbi:MAG: hypothetical protein JXA67_17480 [Micromonosporaceae bacterium]|nr:hypothetical protein [Micromonosporaceae bacterium]